MTYNTSYGYRDGRLVWHSQHAFQIRIAGMTNCFKVCDPATSPQSKAELVIRPQEEPDPPLLGMVMDAKS